MHVLSLRLFLLLRQHYCTVHIEVRTLGLTGKENLYVRVVFKDRIKQTVLKNCAERHLQYRRRKNKIPTCIKRKFQYIYQYLYL